MRTPILGPVVREREALLGAVSGLNQQLAESKRAVVTLEKRVAAWEADILGTALKRIPLKTWLWSDLKTRKLIQSHGINVLPTTFYSNVPSIQEVESSFEYRDGAGPPYELGLTDQDAQAELRSLAPYAADFTPPAEGTDRDTCEHFFWGNGLFMGSDAMAYYCYVRKLKPKAILEIGSGFSTLAACEAVQANGSGKIHCIEPYPREFLRRRKDIDLITRPAQEIDSEFVNDLLSDGDILFIDSTHTVKAGSDCLHIYLRLLPKIRRNIHVHVHDVFLPFGMPKQWLLEKQVFWTEQYLLLALMTDNPKFRVRYSSHYNARRHPDLLAKLTEGKAESGGSSLWFEYRGA
ncbi:MAG TPA: class I SAM-dependent methyltransferase [Gammaproteobacteria bacterium]